MALIVVPARQMSMGRPCKNREAWPALEDCLRSLVPPHHAIIATDDSWCLLDGPAVSVLWRHMDDGHTVADLCRAISDHDPIWVILQPSSPTTGREQYVAAAIRALERVTDATSVISVVRDPYPASKSCTIRNDGTLVIPPGERRQDHPVSYRRDGTVYAVRAEYARKGDLYGPRPVPLLIPDSDSVTLD